MNGVFSPAGGSELPVVRSASILPPARTPSGERQGHGALAFIETMSGGIDLAHVGVFPRSRHLAAVANQDVAPSSEITREQAARAVRWSTGWSLDSAELVPEIIGKSPAVRLMREQIATVARFRDLPVMIMGETGTGKELVAQAIHRLGGKQGSMQAINCAAVPEELFESEVFGHEAGSFTGAKNARAGLFETAGQGTVFLDEVGEMQPLLQAKLLRVLETRQFRRVGSNRTLDLQARIVSATNRPLRGLPLEPMRSDLYFRLAAYTITTPPLRDRMEDIELLAPALLRRLEASYFSNEVDLTPRALDALHAHDWPGNVRELRSVLLHAAVHAQGSPIHVEHVAGALRVRDRPEDEKVPGLSAGALPAQAMNGLQQAERGLILDAYTQSQNNVSMAARRLGIARTTLRDKLKKYGLR
jgi:DNA-binding NtrC family response regulator